MSAFLTGEAVALGLVFLIRLLSGAGPIARPVVAVLLAAAIVGHVLLCQLPVTGVVRNAVLGTPLALIGGPLSGGALLVA